MTKTSGLLGFGERLPVYLLWFERYATIAGWQQDTWAVRLSHCLLVKQWMFFLDYTAKMFGIITSCGKALLQRYDFIKQGYCKRFRNAKLEGQESPGQLIVIIRNDFNKSVKLSEVGKMFEGVEKLMC